MKLTKRSDESYAGQRDLARYGQIWGYGPAGETIAVYQHNAYELRPGAPAFTPAPGGCDRATRCAVLWAGAMGRRVSVWMRAVDNLDGRVWVVTTGERPPVDLFGPCLWITTERAA